MTNDPSNSPSTRPHPEPAANLPLRSISSKELLGTDREIQIIHESTCYRLRVTRQGKLILYK